VADRRNGRGARRARRRSEECPALDGMRRRAGRDDRGWVGGPARLPVHRQRCACARRSLPFRSATIETDFEMGYLQSKLIYDLCVSTGSCAPRVRISPCSSSTLLEGTSRVQGKAWSSVTYCSAAPAGPSPWVYRGVLGAYHHHRRAHRAFVSGLWGAVLWYCVASQVV
jgi:hypothetical protein